MPSVVEIASADQTQRIRRVQFFTIGWMLVEVVVSWFSAWRARSPALFAFGGDSIIELASAVVVLWRFQSGSAYETKESRAARIAGALLFVLAACVAMISAMSLLGYGEPKPSVAGIVILLLAAAVMPLLARAKRKLSTVTGSAALRADAAESAVCAYLSVVALLGVGINSVWRAPVGRSGERRKRTNKVRATRISRDQISIFSSLSPLFFHYGAYDLSPLLVQRYAGLRPSCAAIPVPGI